VRFTIVRESILRIGRYLIAFLVHPVVVSSHQAWGTADIASPHLLSVVMVGISTVDLGKDMDADGIELKMGDVLNNFIVSSKVLSKSISSAPSFRFGDVRETFFKEGKFKVVIIPRVASVPVRKLEKFAQVDVNLLKSSMKGCSCGQGNSPVLV
jgi:hypothetical protein